jgi:aminopeptidase N
MRKAHLLFFLFSSALIAQSPRIDTTFRKNMMAQKSEHYQEMVLCEQQKTINQDAFDIVYYSLDLTPDPTTSTLHGIVEIVAEVTVPTLNRVELNFWEGISITNIFHSNLPGVELNYDMNDDILTIYLEQPCVQGEQFRLTLNYHGRPQDSEYQSFHFDTYNNEPMIWTLSSVFGARAWWPCKDVPSDKPDSVDIRVTVPEDLIVASNGSLRQIEPSGNQKTYWWHEKYPIATYLVFLSIHPYEVHYDNYVYNDNADTMAIHFYSFPGNFDANYQINHLVKDIIGCYSVLFGEYPFVDEKYGQADFLWGGGMEHQTCTNYGAWNESLFAHEIAHQWWGDMITCDSFHHIWLNEGFASYCEALWFEYSYPPYTASEYQMMYQLYLGPGTVYVEHPEYENIFDSNLSYVKGSWVLHMLRHVVGDTVFFNILKAYYTSPEHKFGTATTEEFQSVCESVSGMNLDKFFYQWIYEEWYPQYAYSWNWENEGSDYVIDLEIRQEQTNYTFWMPIDVTLTGPEGETAFVAWDSLATQSFHFTVPFIPERVELDKHNWILKRVPEQFVDPTFDRGVLLVNGVLFDVYGEEIRNSYLNRAFWGDFPIAFWDCFNPPQNGYPSTVPEPLGHGRVPGDVLGQFSTIIWIGNNYGGDIGSWQQTSILQYLEAGGNVLLITRLGQDFIDSELQEYLGITWAENPLSTIHNCVAVYSGLTEISLIGNQSFNAVFETDMASDESALLFQETASFSLPRGLGVWHKPATGGSYRSVGGQFVFISGRPYRYDPEHLRSNIEFILSVLFQEASSSSNGYASDFVLEQNYPNPFTTLTAIRYYLSHQAEVTIKIYNIQGELVRSLCDKRSISAGFQNIVWDGKRADGTGVGTGVYLCQLNCGKSSQVKKMLMLR